MKSRLMSQSLFAALTLSLGCANLHAARRPAQEAERLQGSRVPDFKNTLKALYPELSSFEERAFYPLHSGGTTLMGLVSRLLGEAPRSEFEGLRTQRYFYMLKDANNRVQKIVHGSAFTHDNNTYDVFVAYTPNGVIEKIWAPQFPEKVHGEFEGKGIWAQFNGKSGDDFEVQRKKVSRRKSITIRPALLASAKRPASNEGRALFEKTLRSLRFNVSFMDVAYFITQHPDLADQSDEGFPENVAVTTGTPLSGPEAFVRERASTSSNPFENNKLNILQNLEPKIEKKN